LQSLEKGEGKVDGKAVQSYGYWKKGVATIMSIRNNLRRSWNLGRKGSRGKGEKKEPILQEEFLASGQLNS